ncbi:MAG: hypothetical protein IT348_11835 [Candidatus Eisenbacteria bacterium]|nr:hypothetical protein [Candidatus Eisenbacteria bacterium]
MNQLRPRRRHGALIAILIVLWITVFRPRTVQHEAPPVAPPPAAATAGGTPAPTSDVEAASHAFGPEVGFRSAERLADHFAKHGREFGAANEAEYLAQAQSLRDRATGGDVLELKRDDGVTCRFDRTSGAFLAFNRDGTIRTYFRPNDGERYFERQSQRPRGAP